MSTVIEERRLLMNVAYRLLGSLTDAEEVVQETYVRWYSLPEEHRQKIDARAAWLTKVASRMCIDILRSARRRREQYVGEWIPEPVPDASRWNTQPSGNEFTDPADRVTLDETVGMAFLVVLESMTPAERVAFILHDVFKYPFAEIATVVGRSPEACRQLATSARRRVRSAGPSAMGTIDQAATVKAFKEAWASADIAALVDLLDPDADAVVDGGGLVSAELHPVIGAENVARFFVDLHDRQPGLELVEQSVNGQPGLVARVDGVTVAVIAIDIVGDTIKHLWAVRNPEKLRHWSGGLP